VGSREKEKARMEKGEIGWVVRAADGLMDELVDE